MKRRTRIPNDILGIYRPACRVFFYDFLAAFIERLSKIVNRIFAQTRPRDEMHRPDIHPRKIFCLPPVRIGGNRRGKKERISLKKALFGRFIVGNKINILRRAGLGDRGRGHCTPQKSSSSRSVGEHVNRSRLRIVKRCEIVIRNAMRIQDGS